MYDVFEYVDGQVEQPQRAFGLVLGVWRAAGGILGRRCSMALATGLVVVASRGSVFIVEVGWRGRGP